MTEQSRCEPRIRHTSKVTRVPNNDRAKLMYYLDCVCTVLHFDDNADVNRLRSVGITIHILVDIVRTLVYVKPIVKLKAVDACHCKNPIRSEAGHSNWTL